MSSGSSPSVPLSVAGLGCSPSSWPEPWLTEFHERAAIIEFDGCEARDIAEAEAERIVREAYARGDIVED